MKKKYYNKLFGFSSLILIALVLYFNYYYALNLAKDEQGIFGDMFGASNALFTGLSFTGIIITIILQNRQINETREEMFNQNVNIQIQMFENTFFNLINIQHQFISTMNSSDETSRDGVIVERKYVARGVFFDIFSVLYERINSEGDNFEKEYNFYYENLNYHLDHYFNNFFQIIRFVEQSDIILKKGKYLEILRAQLSEHEKLMLFFHALYKKDLDYKILLEKYGILANFNKTLVPENLIKRYNHTVFSY